MSRKQALIRGTAVLTVTSLSTRFMGFFYRMFQMLLQMLQPLILVKLIHMRPAAMHDFPLCHRYTFPSRGCP